MGRKKQDDAPESVKKALTDNTEPTVLKYTEDELVCCCIIRPRHWVDGKTYGEEVWLPYWRARLLAMTKDVAIIHDHDGAPHGR